MQGHILSKLYEGLVISWKSNDFLRVRIKLTLLYTLIITLIIIFFSFLINIQIWNSIYASKLNAKTISAEEVWKIINRINPDAQIQTIEKEDILDTWRYNIILKNWDEIKINPYSWKVYTEFENTSSAQEALTDFQFRLIQFIKYLDIFIILIASILSYFLAWITLKPIADKLKEQKQFIADISHELRNPLASLWASCDSLLRRKSFTIKNAQEVLGDIKSETNRLIHITEKLLTIISLEQKIDEVYVKIHINDVIKEIAKLLSSAWAVKNIKIITHFKSDIFINANIEDFQRVFLNLIENAIKFSHIGGDIHIYIKENGSVHIQDTGMGIEKKYLENIFRRFYKVDEARSFDYIWSGLGLSIVKTILNKYGLTIEVQSELWKWSDFSINFSWVRLF